MVDASRQNANFEVRTYVEAQLDTVVMVFVEVTAGTVTEILYMHDVSWLCFPKLHQNAARNVRDG